MSEIAANTVQEAGRPAVTSPAGFFFAIAGWFSGLKAAGLRRAQEPLEIAIAEAQRQRSQSRVPTDPHNYLAAEQRCEEQHRCMDRLFFM